MLILMVSSTNTNMYLILHMNIMMDISTLTLMTMRVITVITLTSMITTMTTRTIPTCLPERMVRLSPGAVYWRLVFQAGYYPVHLHW